MPGVRPSVSKLMFALFGVTVTVPPELSAVIPGVQPQLIVPEPEPIVTLEFAVAGVHDGTGSPPDRSCMSVPENKVLVAPSPDSAMFPFTLIKFR